MVAGIIVGLAGIAGMANFLIVKLGSSMSSTLWIGRKPQPIPQILKTQLGNGKHWLFNIAEERHQRIHGRLRQDDDVGLKCYLADLVAHRIGIARIAKNVTLRLNVLARPRAKLLDKFHAWRQGVLERAKYCDFRTELDSSTRYTFVEPHDGRANEMAGIVHNWCSDGASVQDHIYAKQLSLLIVGQEAALSVELLASNGMLVKRPLLIVDGKPLVPGFKEAMWGNSLFV